MSASGDRSATERRARHLPPASRPFARTVLRKGARPIASSGASQPSPTNERAGQLELQLIWRQASPRWHFDDATFDRSAASFENPDHVEIVVHNHRWRLGLAGGEPRYDELERRLAQAPTIGVPTVTLEGDANGV